jgi:hypothetical protein
MNKKILSALLTIVISTSIYANPTIKTSTKPLIKNEVGKLPTSTQEYYDNTDNVPPSNNAQMIIIFKKYPVISE